VKYKAIRSAAHNFAASFVSTLNWAGDDHTMSHLVRSAVSSGVPEFTVNLLTGRAGPESFLTAPVADAVRRYVLSFPDFLAQQRVEVPHLTSARMVVRILLKGTVAAQGGPPPWSVPFECEVDIIDDRGKEHAGRVADIWHMGDDIVLASS
jgi:hypothetical protein